MRAKRMRPNNFPIWLVSPCHGHDGPGPAVLCCADREAADVFVRGHGPGDYAIRRRHVALMRQRNTASAPVTD